MVYFRRKSEIEATYYLDNDEAAIVGRVRVRVAAMQSAAMRRKMDVGSGTAVGVSWITSIWSGMLRLIVVGLLYVAVGSDELLGWKRRA